MPIFIVFFENNQKFAKKKPKNDNFSHFAKHRFIKKKTLCCNPPLDQKLVFFNVGFSKPKTMMLNKKHNSKSGQNKDNKRDFKEKTRQETKKREHIDEQKKLQFNIFMLFYWWNKSKEERTMKKETKQETKRKPKNKDKKEERKTRAKERQRKRNRKGGGQKMLREEERETLKINLKMPFWGEKTGFFY